MNIIESTLMRRRKEKERFYERIDYFRGLSNENNCWYFNSFIDPDGYGQVRINRKTTKAHRYSWELYNKCKVPEGKLVLHKCDNRICVNPNHLYVGTEKDNARDAITRNRFVTGSRNGMAVLSEVKIKLIQEYLSKGYSRMYIERSLRISRNTLERFINKKTYKEIPR